MYTRLIRVYERRVKSRSRILNNLTSKSGFLDLRLSRANSASRTTASTAKTTHTTLSSGYETRSSAITPDPTPENRRNVPFRSTVTLLVSSLGSDR